MNITENQFAAFQIVHCTIPEIERSIANGVKAEECAAWGITPDQWVEQSKLAMAEKRYAAREQ